MLGRWFGKGAGLVTDVALGALRDQSAAMTAVLARQVAVEEARVALERERWQWERDRADRLDAEQRAWRAQADGLDLPEAVARTVTELAAGDSALKAQLVRYARQRLDRDVSAERVVTELRFGQSNKGL